MLSKMRQNNRKLGRNFLKKLPIVKLHFKSYFDIQLQFFLSPMENQLNDPYNGIRNEIKKMKIPLPAILNARPLPPPPLPWKYESTRFEYKFLPINQFFTENMLLPSVYSCRFRYTETGFSCCLLMGRAVRKLGRLNSIKLGNFRIRAHSEESKMTYNGPLRPKAETSYPLYPST